MIVNRIPYRTSLRVLGRLLNGEKARMVTVCELEEGFLLHYCVQGDPARIHSRAIYKSEVLDLDDMLRGKRERGNRFKGLDSILLARQNDALRFQKSHPLVPMGYEEFFRAVGAAIDRRGAQAVLITELDDCVHVEYTVDRADFVLRHGQRLALPGRRQERYTADQMIELIAKMRLQIGETVRSSGELLSFNPMDVTAYVTAALALEDEGQDKDAEELFTRALQIDPEYPDVHYHLARQARRRGDDRVAFKHLQSAISLKNSDPRFLHLLARMNMEHNRLNAAAAAMQQTIAYDPDNPIYLFDLDRLNEALSKHGNAPVILSAHPSSALVQDADGSVSEPLDLSAFMERSGPETAEKTTDAPPNTPTDASIASRLSGYGEPSSLNESLFAADNTMRDALDWDTHEGLRARLDKETPPAESTEYGDDGMPLFNLPATEEAWSTPALPEIRVLPHEEAAAALPQEATALPPEDVAPEPQTAPAAAGDDQLSAQIARAQELANAEPDRAELHRRLGFLLAKQGRSEEAAASFRRAVECGRRRMTGK